MKTMRIILLLSVIIPACGFESGTVTVTGVGTDASRVEYLWYRLTQHAFGGAQPLPTNLHVKFSRCEVPGYEYMVACHVSGEGLIYAKDGRCDLVLHELTHFALYHYAGDADGEHVDSAWLLMDEVVAQECY